MMANALKDAIRTVSDLPKIDALREAKKPMVSFVLSLAGAVPIKGCP